MRPDFFDVVHVTGSSASDEIRGRRGYIVGIAEENGQQFLSAWIYDPQEVWCVDEADLTFLGHKDQIAAAAHENRKSIRVRVNPETGEGEIG